MLTENVHFLAMIESAIVIICSVAKHVNPYQIPVFIVT